MHVSPHSLFQLSFEFYYTLSFYVLIANIDAQRHQIVNWCQQWQQKYLKPETVYAILQLKETLYLVSRQQRQKRRLFSSPHCPSEPCITLFKLLPAKYPHWHVPRKQSAPDTHFSLSVHRWSDAVSGNKHTHTCTYILHYTVTTLHSWSDAVFGNKHTHVHTHYITHLVWSSFWWQKLYTYYSISWNKWPGFISSNKSI